MPCTRMPAMMLWPTSRPFGQLGRPMAQMIAISTTTIAMRIARYVSGSALWMTYLVPTKPVLHSTTKIAGAARAANLSKSSVIWRALVPNPVLCGNTHRGKAASPLSHNGHRQRGIAMDVRAAVATSAGKPLEISTVQLGGPREGEVMVEIKATGVCHTDEFTLSGADPEGLFPAILGHEGAGVVVEVGPGVTSVKKGDHVIPLYTPE